GRNIAKVVDAARAVMEEFAREKGYKLIMEYDPQVVLYADPKFDISKDVVALLDKTKLSLNVDS
ncbi:MAG: OmpH family outer membrane protein, partial [Bdellovibrionales bacterium]|nr:OmpH family outer membrane protein [Bdellovibrionales bacterium]